MVIFNSYVSLPQGSPGFADDFSLSDRIPSSFPLSVDGATREAHFQPGASGGLPKMEAYNVRRDPGEKYGHWVRYQNESQHLNRKPLRFPWKTIVLPVKFPIGSMVLVYMLT